MNTETNTAINRRPSAYDEKIIEAAAQRLAPKVLEWSGEDDDKLEEIQRNLAEALEYDTDGFEVAKKLERSGYSPDAALVDILDEAFFLTHEALSVAERQWVSENNLQPIPLESKVRSLSKPEAGDGIVTKNHDDGKSTVMFPSLGHVREGMGTHGLIIPWERLVIAP